jgi:hypothetical protein
MTGADSLNGFFMEDLVDHHVIKVVPDKIMSQSRMISNRKVPVDRQNQKPKHPR